MCNDCPFSKNSLKGFLADYKVQDFVTFMNNEVLFPCHKIVPDVGMYVKDLSPLVQKGVLRLCRGYTESMSKSAKIPRDRQFASIIKNIPLSEESMSIFEFIEHHTIKKEE
jgi:hypothetical protein